MFRLYPVLSSIFHSAPGPLLLHHCRQGDLPRRAVAAFGHMLFHCANEQSPRLPSTLGYAPLSFVAEDANFSPRHRVLRGYLPASPETLFVCQGPDASPWQLSPDPQHYVALRDDTHIAQSPTRRRSRTPISPVESPPNQMMATSPPGARPLVVKSTGSGTALGGPTTTLGYSLGLQRENPAAVAGPNTDVAFAFPRPRFLCLTPPFLRRGQSVRHAGV